MKNRNMLQKWLIILFLGLITQAVSAQNINVHGIITDETGETMIGVSVLVKGTSTGVVTDVNAVSYTHLDYQYGGQCVDKRRRTGICMDARLF